MTEASVDDVEGQKSVYQALVEEWIAAIKTEESLADCSSSIADVDK